MKHYSLLSFLLMFVFVASAVAQNDEARTQSGLPTMIGGERSTRGGNTITVTGRLTVQGYQPQEGVAASTFAVSIEAGGFVIGRREVKPDGSFMIGDVPREGARLIVEVDRIEITSYALMPSVTSSVRQDVIITWQQVESARRSPGTTRAKSLYERTDANEKLYDKASAAARDKKGQAVSLFKELLANDPKDFVAWAELGNVYFLEKRNGDAASAYKKALELKPDYAVALVNYGKLEITENNTDSAIELLKKAVAAEPNSPEAQHFLGEAYLQARKGSLAVGHLNKAIELAPIAKADVHLRLAALYNAAGVKHLAVAEYKMFLEKIKDHPERKKIEKYIQENSK